MVAPSERLQKAPERLLWIGEDFVLTERLVLPPGAVQDGEVGFSSLVLPQDFSTLRVSTRSPCALLGLEIISSGEQILEGLILNGEARTQLRFKNHGIRTAILAEGKKVGRPYMEAQANIEGDALDALLGKGIHIDGPQGFWQKLLDKDKKPRGVRLDLDPSSRRQVVPGGPIVFDFNGGYREEIDRYVTQIEADAEPSFWFGETYAHIKIDDDIVGLLQDPSSPRVHMLNSHLIYGGNTNWPIRVEVVSATFSWEMPAYVDMVFQKTK